MVMRLNKICLGITDVSLFYSPLLQTPNMWWETAKEKMAFYITVTYSSAEPWHAVPKDLPKEAFIPLK